MNQSFYTWSNLNECTVVCKDNHFSCNLLSNFQSILNSIPWVSRQLFQTKSNSLLVIIEVKNNNVDLRIQLNNLFRMNNTSPRKVSNVNQSIYAAKVNEYTVACDVFNHTFQYLSFFKARHDLLLLFFQLSFNKRFVRNNYVLEFVVNLNNFQFHNFSNVNVVITNWLNVDLRSR